MESKKESYVISLDAVDLNLLPISQTHRDGGTVPLWSKSDLDSRRNEYYEFVIKSDDAKEDYRMESKKESYVISLDAVDLNLLPISQSKSNLDSRRNEYYEFVIKSDDAKEVIENVTCHICDINVPKVYFNEHKNGFRHKFNRKVADTALKRLKLYVNKEGINELNEKLPSKHFCTECSIVIDSEDETSHKQTTGHRNSLFLERFLNDFLNFYTNDDNKIDNTRKYMKTEAMRESTNSEQDVVFDELNVIETVLANMKKESIKKKDVIETKATENYKTILNSDKQNNNLRPSSDLQDDYVFLNVIDGPNINKLKVAEMSYDAIVVTGATSEYCMICNQMFVRENRLLHVDSKLHDQNLRLKSLDKNCVRKINSTHHHCVLCNDCFTEYYLHVNSKEHLTNFRNMIIHECDKTVQGNDNCIKDKKYDNSTKCSDDINKNENKSSTSTNKDTAPVNNGTRNSLVPSTSSSVVKNSNKTTNSYFCKVCQVNVPNNEKNIAMHNKGTSHQLKLQETKAVNNTKVEAINSYFCEICQVNVPNNMNNIAEHNRGESHKQNFRETKAGTKVEAISNKKSYLHYQMKETERLNYVTCIVCNTYLSYNDRNILTHIEGENHKSNYNEFCKRNLLVPRDKFLYCTACGVIPGLRNEFAHCNGRNHKSNLEEVDSI